MVLRGGWNLSHCLRRWVVFVHGSMITISARHVAYVTGSIPLSPRANVRLSYDIGGKRIPLDLGVDAIDGRD